MGIEGTTHGRPCRVIPGCPYPKPLRHQHNVGQHIWGRSRPQYVVVYLQELEHVTVDAEHEEL